MNGLRDVLKEGIKAENTPILLSRSKSDQKIHDFCVNTFLFFTFLEEIFTLGFFNTGRIECCSEKNEKRWGFIGD